MSHQSTVKAPASPAKKKRRVGFLSLGCAKNLVDSEVMLGRLAKEHYEISTDANTCDVAIINTCGFIESARKESINEILRLVDRKTSGHIKRLVVAGCLAQKHAAELAKEIPEIDALVGTGEYHKIHRILEHLDGKKPVQAVAYPEFLYDHLSPRHALTAAHSRYIKIAEGCNHTCSFCIIPQMRGAYRSRPVDSVVTEVSALAKQGLREVNLISQETTYYGRDIDRTYHLPKLLEALNRVPEIAWIRLFYNHPQHMANEIIEAIKSFDKVLPYIDMPLQHASDRILKSMRRGVTKEKTVRLLDQIRNTIPNAVLRTTLIVGYPGETDEEFDELCQFVENTRFHHVGVFTYSRERDVSSGHLPNQLPERVKKDRYHKLMSIQQPISLAYNQALLGQTEEVLIDGPGREPHWYVGRTYRHAPDVDGQVLVESLGENLLPGHIVNARITDAMPYDLLARFVSFGTEAQRTPHITEAVSA